MNNFASVRPQTTIASDTDFHQSDTVHRPVAPVASEEERGRVLETGIYPKTPSAGAKQSKQRSGQVISHWSHKPVIVGCDSQPLATTDDSRSLTCSTELPEHVREVRVAIPSSCPSVSRMESDFAPKRGIQPPTFDIIP